MQKLRRSKAPLRRGGKNVRPPGWNLNGRYVPDNAAITYRSGAVLEVHELNIKSGEMPQKTGYRRELRSRLCIQMSAWILLQPFAPSSVSMSTEREYKWTGVSGQVLKVEDPYLDRGGSCCETVLHNHVCKLYHIRPCIPLKLRVTHALNCL